MGTNGGIGRVADWIPEAAKDLGFKDVKVGAIVSRNVAKLGIAKLDCIHFVDGDVSDWNNLKDDTYVDVRFSQDTGGKHVFFKGGEISGKTAAQLLKLDLDVDIYTGTAFAADPQKVLAARRLNPAMVEDGLAETVSQGKHLPKRRVIERNACRFEEVADAP